MHSSSRLQFNIIRMAIVFFSLFNLTNCLSTPRPVDLKGTETPAQKAELFKQNKIIQASLFEPQQVNMSYTDDLQRHLSLDGEMNSVEADEKRN